MEDPSPTLAGCQPSFRGTTPQLSGAERHFSRSLLLFQAPSEYFFGSLLDIRLGVPKHGIDHPGRLRNLEFTSS